MYIESETFQRLCYLAKDEAHPNLLLTKREHSDCTSTLKVSVWLGMVPRITIANNAVHSFADWIASVCDTHLENQLLAEATSY